MLPCSCGSTSPCPWGKIISSQPQPSITPLLTGLQLHCQHPPCKGQEGWTRFGAPGSEPTCDRGRVQTKPQLLGCTPLTRTRSELQDLGPVSQPVAADGKLSRSSWEEELPVLLSFTFWLFQLLFPKNILPSPLSCQVRCGRPALQGGAVVNLLPWGFCCPLMRPAGPASLSGIVRPHLGSFEQPCRGPAPQQGAMHVAHVHCRRLPRPPPSSAAMT